VAGREVVIPDSFMSPRGDGTKVNLVPEAQIRSKNPYRSNAPPKLGSTTEKPNNFDPTPFLTKQKPGANTYQSAQQDSHRSHIHHRSENPKFGQSPLNPHKVLPPISTGNSEHNPSQA